MEMTGEYRIAASREKVWAALNDPEILKACIPGCESLEKSGDNEFKANVRAKIGPVSARFAGKVTLTDIDPPNGYRIVGEGQGGAAGFAKGGAVVKLDSEGSDTVLRYTADAQVGGKLAQIGSRLVDGSARKLAEEFFSAFAARLATPADAAPAAPGAADETPAVTAAAAQSAGGVSPEAAAMTAPPAAAAPAAGAGTPAASPRGGTSPWMWVVGAAAVVVVLYLVFGG